MFFVEVFPLEPVMPMTVKKDEDRTLASTSFANALSASTVSETTIWSMSTESEGSETMASAAPFEETSDKKR